MGEELRTEGAARCFGKLTEASAGYVAHVRTSKGLGERNEPVERGGK